MIMEKQKAIFINTFKTKRLDGHSVKTVYALIDNGIIKIERRILSTELNEGFTKIRTFGKYIYQYESMVFKFGSFMQIAIDVNKGASELNNNDLIGSQEIRYQPNEEHKVELYTEH